LPALYTAALVMVLDTSLVAAVVLDTLLVVAVAAEHN
jgi:hypothetical protein